MNNDNNQQRESTMHGPSPGGSGYQANGPRGGRSYPFDHTCQINRNERCAQCEYTMREDAKKAADHRRNMQLLCIALTFLVCPPVGVVIYTRSVKSFLINILLTLMFILPGIIHAVWVITKKPRGDEEYGLSL